MLEKGGQTADGRVGGHDWMLVAPRHDRRNVWNELSSFRVGPTFPPPGERGHCYTVVSHWLCGRLVSLFSVNDLTDTMATKRGQKTGLEALASNGKAAPKASPANAWAKPLKTTGPPPGLGPASAANKAKVPTPPTSGNARAAPASTRNPPAKTSSSSALSIPNIHRERLLHLSFALVGQKVSATLVGGTVIEGVLHTFTPFANLPAEKRNKYVISTAQLVKKGTDTITVNPGATLVLAVEKVSHILAKNVDLEQAAAAVALNKGGDLITDTQISSARGTKASELVAAGTEWTKGRADAMLGALEDTKGTRKGFGTALKGADTSSGLQGSIGQWDQFKANQELFNVNATFDENLYTTALDKSQIDRTKIAEAERIAREIENTTSSNIHISEERGHAVETDYDEEDRYSGVLTKDGKQRHEEKAATPAPAPVPVPPKKMNYAAAAAKADAKKVTPPPKAKPQPAVVTPATATKSAEPASKVTPEIPKTAPPAEQEEEVKTETPVEKAPEPAQEEKPVGTETAEKKEAAATEEAKDAPKTEKKETKSKLNANAKAFTFNPSAKSFTPSFGGGGGGGASYTAPMAAPQPVDPNMQMHAGGHPMQAQYMHAGMTAGMMPMMNPQFSGMRYPPQYAGMDQAGMVPQMPPQQPHGGPPTATPPTSSGAPPTTGDAAQAPAKEEPAQSETPQEGESSQPAQQSQSHQQQPQQAVPMPYGVNPQGAYFAGNAMAMHGRNAGYPPQYVGQQMPVAPGGAAYRPMYPMQPGAMPPNMHMRGPGGTPYYPGPGGPMPYPPGGYGHGMGDDDAFRGRGGGGRGTQGRGRGRGGRRPSGGRGRGNYQGQPYGGQHSGRNTPQTLENETAGETEPPTEAPKAAEEASK
eukprot:Nitzschia sp. Nitz4//scaffold96_size78090//12139//15166//NITZ4_005485-RA/size78090-augustus-gene-0.0-mRNA-1//1//CDS//3329560546//99//frame0